MGWLPVVGLLQKQQQQEWLILSSARYDAKRSTAFTFSLKSHHNNRKVITLHDDRWLLDLVW